VARAKKQHYVSQSYLKRFTDDNERLWVFDKSIKQSFRTHVKNVASETGFYDITQETADEDADRQFVEKTLSKIESVFPTVIDDLLRSIDEEQSLDPNWKEAIAIMLYIQLFRTREARELLIGMAESTDQSLQDLIAKAKIPESSKVEFPVQFDREKAPLEQAHLMFNRELLDETVQLLNNEYAWTVGVNHMKQPLYTSDNPVVKDGDPENLPFFSEIAFPLTPKHILILGYKTVLRDSANLDCRVVPLNIKNVTFYNSLQVFQCYRHIYCPRKTFSFARQICNKYPEWCRRDRPRMRKLLFYKNIESTSDNILSDSIVIMDTPLHPNTEFSPSPYISIKKSPGKWKLDREGSSD